MKHIFSLLLVALILVSCKQETKQNEEVTETEKQEIAYASFGKEINDADVITAAVMADKYANMTVGDSANVKMIAKVDEVCQAKGCWMKLDLSNGEQVMVKFKDYGFFMPLNAEGDVVVNGKAFVTETSVDELRHYAEDAGKSEEEIAAITEPKFEYRFEADGVLLKQ